MRKALAALCLLFLCSFRAFGQDVPSDTTYVAQWIWIHDNVHDFLATRWDTTPGQKERAYCVRFGLFFNSEAAHHTEYHVTEIWAAETSGATPGGIEDVTCSSDPDVTVVHTHPPHTLERGDSTYHSGGIEAYECWPSSTDYTTLMVSNSPFALIQCDKNAIIAYWKKPYSVFEPEIIHFPVYVIDTVLVLPMAPPAPVPLVKRLWEGLRRIF